jgi:predicted nucleotide-binding protein
VDVLAQINNAVLDLQASQFQTFDRPLRTLGRLLTSEQLRATNEELLANVNLDQILEASSKTGGSFVGSKTFLWPEDPKQALGVSLALILRMAQDPEFAQNISFEYFYVGSKITANIQSLVRQLIIPFARDYREYVRSRGEIQAARRVGKSKKVFVVHGHDAEARESVARFLDRLGLESVILHEQPNRGRTIIEKVETYREVGFAVILLTPDDVGRSVTAKKLEARARQNVLLELGFFLAALGRENVCALRRGNVVIPTDFLGVVWTDFDSSGGWKQALGRELQAAGYTIDWNRVMVSGG